MKAIAKQVQSDLPMAAMQYLTVQDILWINLHVTGAPQEFRFADLEEATYYQYGYGGSKSLIPQAANFLSGFLKKKPIAAGNEATAFIGCLSFLKVNGVSLKLDDPLAWFRGIEDGTLETLDAIEKSHFEDHGDHHLEVSDAIEAIKLQYADVISKLSAVMA